MIDVCVPGTGGSIPKPDRWLACAYLRHNGRSILIDCGEGTQLALKKTGFSFCQIGLILITHFHADHISGLPGMLLSMGNEGRTDPVAIAGPPGLINVVRSLCIIAGTLPFEVYLYEFQADGGVLPKEYFIDCEESSLKISAFRCNHSVPCLGYRIDLPRLPKFDPSRARSNGIPVNLWSQLQNGKIVTDGDAVYTPDMVLGPPRKGITISYVTDSRPSDIIKEGVRGSDLLICESTFTDEKEERALKSKHMTAKETATIAKDSEVSELWLTHYSPSVTKPSECLADASKIFANTVASYDGMHRLMRFPGEE